MKNINWKMIYKIFKIGLVISLDVCSLINILRHEYSQATFEVLLAWMIQQEIWDKTDDS